MLPSRYNQAGCWTWPPGLRQATTLTALLWTVLDAMSHEYACATNHWHGKISMGQGRSDSTDPAYRPSLKGMKRLTFSFALTGPSALPAELRLVDHKTCLAHPCTNFVGLHTHPLSFVASNVEKMLCKSYCVAWRSLYRTAVQKQILNLQQFSVNSLSLWVAYRK